MRLFKVYDGLMKASDLVFAKNHFQAAQIVKGWWEEQSMICSCFRVVELTLPQDLAQTSVGMVLEPAGEQQSYIVRESRLQAVRAA